MTDQEKVNLLRMTLLSAHVQFTMLVPFLTGTYRKSAEGAAAACKKILDTVSMSTPKRRPMIEHTPRTGRRTTGGLFYLGYRDCEAGKLVEAFGDIPGIRGTERQRAAYTRGFSAARDKQTRAMNRNQTEEC